MGEAMTKRMSAAATFTPRRALARHRFAVVFSTRSLSGPTRTGRADGSTWTPGKGSRTGVPERCPNVPVTPIRGPGRATFIQTEKYIQPRALAVRVWQQRVGKNFRPLKLSEVARCVRRSCRMREGFVKCISGIELRVMIGGYRPLLCSPLPTSCWGATTRGVGFGRRRGRESRPGRESARDRSAPAPVYHALEVGGESPFFEGLFPKPDTSPGRRLGIRLAPLVRKPCPLARVQVLHR